MTPCLCGKEPEHQDNTPDLALYRANEHTLMHRVLCDECGIKTSFYPTQVQAIVAWENKGWVNKRRAA